MAQERARFKGQRWSYANDERNAAPPVMPGRRRPAQRATIRPRASPVVVVVVGVSAMPAK
jgi:hypothetical protein